MSKMNVHTTTGELAASTNELLVRIRESRKQLQGHLSHLRDVEGQIKANLQKEREAAMAAAPDTAPAASEPARQEVAAPAGNANYPFRENRGPRPAPRDGQQRAGDRAPRDGQRGGFRDGAARDGQRPAGRGPAPATASAAVSVTVATRTPLPAALTAARAVRQDRAPLTGSWLL